MSVYLCITHRRMQVPAEGSNCMGVPGLGSYLWASHYENLDPNSGLLQEQHLFLTTEL